jgi:catechol 2,3-dioxygenase-like lactoylglutathione lyase family enzyme
MRPQRLDHVALYVSDPEQVAARLLSRLPFRVLEETDEFVLVGRAPELGKITLFEAPGPRDRGSLLRLGIGVPYAAESTTLDLDDGLGAILVPGRAEGDVDLDHIALLVSDPEASAAEWVDFGFELADSPTGAVRQVRLGDVALELHRGTPRATDRPLLNHLGLLVESAEEAERAAEDQDLDVNKVVDAENSKAVFVRGPDGVEVEFIEHKPSFALA